MSLPASIFVLIGAVSFSIQGIAQEKPAPRKTHFAWEGGKKSPAICVGQAGWFVGIVPESVDIEPEPTATVEFAGKQVDAKLLHLDAENRLCLFESSEEFEDSPPVPLSNSGKLKPGAKMHCPTGLGDCASTYAGKEWCYRGHRFESPLLHLRLADLSRNCRAGTPLFNKKGELEGIVTAHQIGIDNEVFAIPVSRIDKLVTDIKHHQKSGPVWIGLLFHMESSSPEVMAVKADSPSSLAGIEPGDVVLAVNGEAVEDLNDLVEIIQTLPAGAKASFKILREFNRIAVTLTPQFAAPELAGNQ